MLLISVNRPAYHGRKFPDSVAPDDVAEKSLPIRRLVWPTNQARRTVMVFEAPASREKGTNRLAPGLGSPVFNDSRSAHTPSATSFHAIVRASHQPPRNQA